MVHRRLRWDESTRVGVKRRCPRGFGAPSARALRYGLPSPRTGIEHLTDVASGVPWAQLR
ncbi:MAG: hypothetical protein FJ298_12530 [Planctomycetes bacterium]|nr:hypothetical protein [Planctomycetota bacterium]